MGSFIPSWGRTAMRAPVGRASRLGRPGPARGARHEETLGHETDCETKDKWQDNSREV